jgi:hypothetical protein
MKPGWQKYDNLRIRALEMDIALESIRYPGPLDNIWKCNYVGALSGLDLEDIFSQNPLV